MKNGGGRGGCPDRETLWAAARGELPRPRSTALLDHVRSCTACHEAWRLARVFSSGTEPSGMILPRGDRLASAARRRYGLLAAALAPLVLGAFFLWHAYTLYPPLPAASRPATTARPAELASHVGTTLPRDDFVLVWEGVEDALYRLEVYTESAATIVAEAGLGEPSFRMPPERLVTLAPGTPLYWQVTAVLPGGKLLESPRYRIELR